MIVKMKHSSFICLPPSNLCLLALFLLCCFIVVKPVQSSALKRSANCESKILIQELLFRTIMLNQCCTLNNFFFPLLFCSNQISGLINTSLFSSLSLNPLLSLALFFPLEVTLKVSLLCLIRHRTLFLFLFLPFLCFH